MHPRIRSLFCACALGTALAAGSLAAQADDHSEMHHGGRHNYERMCEEFRAGTGRFDRDRHQTAMAERREAMAKRLMLSEEQREIWDQIHSEQRARHEERRQKWQQKMQQRCDGNQ